MREVATISNRLRVIFNEGKLFIVALSMDLRPLKLAPFDLPILNSRSPLNEEGQEWLSVKKLQMELQGNAMPSQVIMQRIKQLAASRLFDFSDDRSNNSINVITSSELSGSSTKLSNTCNTYQLAANFALIPTNMGFVAWSARAREYLLMSDEHLCAVEWFIKPRTISLKQNSHSIAVWLLQAALELIDFGCVVIAPKLDSKAPLPPTVEHSQNSHQIQPKAWVTLPQESEKIPVYFTPHTQNHIPLALGMLHAAISSYRDGALLEKFQLIPITYMHPNEMINGLLKKFGPGVWLFSNYMWSLDFNTRFSKGLKQLDDRNLTIHGGPSTPNYEQACQNFMKQNSSVDIAVHGEGELTIQAVMERIERKANGNIGYQDEALKQVAGITFRRAFSKDIGSRGMIFERDDYIRTSDRARLKNMDSIPSPYLSQAFDKYDLNVQAAIVETNRGCPFGCTFCDWGSATMQKIRKFDVERVRQEIEWIGRHNIKVLWIADANYGVFDRDIEIAQMIVDTKQKYGFPREVVVNYTKNTTSRLVEIIKIFSAGNIISQGIISIQTTDSQTLEVINRKNIKTKKYDELTKIFAAANLPLSTDLMIGLPGSTLESFEKDLQRYIDVDVIAKAYPTQLLPNSPMADPNYIEKYKIKVDKDDYVISCFSFSEAELSKMKHIYSIFVVAESYAVLRYVMRYLQWEKGIPAITFLKEISNQLAKNSKKFTHVTWVMRYFIDSRKVPGGWKAFYDEIAEIIEMAFGIKKDLQLETALLVNELHMPDDMHNYPLTAELSFDYVDYYRLNSQTPSKVKQSLANFSSAKIILSDPDDRASSGRMFSQYDDHQYFWELTSEISRVKSAYASSN
ncbi:MAG: radical SAM protein [Kangiellaceae bacterium]